MPCSCFGKKDKKGGVLGEEEKYRPRDSRERDPPVSQSKPLLAAAGPTPAAPDTPPTPQPQSTPSTGGGDARLRPEDDPDKASRRRDVVASFYSDQCELIGFKTTGSRPPSAHVGSHSDGPAATSSPAASSPASTRSAGASCRADLAEKRREFFRDLAVEDDTSRSRPTSRLTDPGSQVTPRNSHYQDQLHHTLPHQNKTSSRSNKFSSPPLFLQHSLKKTPTSPKSSSSAKTSSSEDTQPLLHSSPELSPKTSPKHSEHSLAEIPITPPETSENHRHLLDKVNENVHLLSEKHTVSTISTEISLKSTDQPYPESKQITDFALSDSPELNVDLSPKENSKLIDGMQNVNENTQAIDPKSQQSLLVIDNLLVEGDLKFTDTPSSGNDLLVNEQVFDNFSLDPQYITDTNKIIASTPKVEVFAKHETKTPDSETCRVENPPSTELFDLDFSSEVFPQTLPVIVNETLKESSKAQPLDHATFDFTAPHDNQIGTSESPDEQTIVKTTRQFISVSPDDSKTSQTIVETTRQFIAGPLDEENAQTIVETTQQYLTGSPDEQRTTQTIVETTRQFISGIPEDIDFEYEGEPNIMSTTQQFFTGSPDEQTQTVVKTVQQFVSGNSDEQTTQTVVQTTKSFVSGGPDGEITTTVETTEQSLPTSVNSIFLTSAEEPEELPEKMLVQSSSFMTHSLKAPTLLPTEIEILEEEEMKEEPKLPDVPCFGAPPPPASPPPPLPEEESAEVSLTSLDASLLPQGLEEPLPPVPPSPPAEQVLAQSLPTAALLEQQQQQHFEDEIQSPHTPSTASSPHGEDEDLPPAPPTPPTPRLNEVQLPSSTSPLENEILPPTPPTPHREDDMPPAKLTPSKDVNEKLLPAAPPTPPISSSPPLPPVTCGVELVSSSPLEDDGLGSEIDDAIETLEGLSEEELVNIMAGELASLVARLETAVERLEKVGVSKAAALSSLGGGGGVPNAQPQEEECTVPYVLAYDDLLSGPFKAFLDCSNQIGGDVAEIAKLVQETFINQRAFLVMASKSQRPLDTELPLVLEPTGMKIQEVIKFREAKRQSPLFNHLSAVSESIPGLSWVTVTPAPGPYVKEMGDSAVFYTNRVLKEYREKDKLHVEWVQNWNNVFKELQSYVLAHHTTGLSWNTRGGNAMNNLKPAPPNCGVPPPPPPGIPPPPPMVKLEPKAIAADDGRAALFESINKGTDITSGLKKVTDDMKTHKNPGLREGPKPFVKANAVGGGKSTPAPAEPPSRPPKFGLEGKKWFVEYQKDKPDLLISQTRMDQSVYIFRCENTVVQVKGKVNSVILDSCKKSSVVFDDLVSSAEVVNCQSCQVQVMGVMPTITIEKTDGCQVYLSKASLKTEIISAKSTAMNILIPGDDGEFTECPIPEQFKTLVSGRSLVTSCTEAAG